MCTQCWQGCYIGYMRSGLSTRGHFLVWASASSARRHVVPVMLILRPALTNFNWLGPFSPDEAVWHSFSPTIDCTANCSYVTWHDTMWEEQLTNDFLSILWCKSKQLILAETTDRAVSSLTSHTGPDWLSIFVRLQYTTWRAQRYTRQGRQRDD